jgi:hypothetical protein
MLYTLWVEEIQKNRGLYQKKWQKTSILGGIPYGFKDTKGSMEEKTPL